MPLIRRLAVAIGTILVLCGMFLLWAAYAHGAEFLPLKAHRYAPVLVETQGKLWADARAPWTLAWLISDSVGACRRFQQQRPRNHPISYRFGANSEHPCRARAHIGR